jgi:hypothetical protein
VILAVLLALAAGDPPDYAREVRPILARHCFKCHGPDERARKGGLRLDSFEGAVAKLKSGARAVVPGKPAESELLKRVSSADPDEVMPPPDAKNPLPAGAADVLRRWIAAGAEYKPHWSFVPPKAAALPDVKDSAWVRNPIDRFVLARLEREGLKPSPPADAATLLRRVSLDLTGLPPGPEDAEGDYETLVDRLLASPRYGERWARRWLDLARYADTNGYEKDRPRSIWPWRDWVIRSLNEDLPFDRFTVEQLAGDLLPDATPSQRIATGFHRNTMLNEEGGIDPLEFRYYAVADRVATTGAAWLGLTLGCAQCHTHKFDPITHREYFALFAYLNNADEPELAVPSPETEAKRREVEAKAAALEAGLAAKFPPEPLSGPDDSRSEDERRRAHLEKKSAAWLERETARLRPWTLVRPVTARSEVPFLEVLEDGSVLAGGDQTKRDVYLLELPDLAGATALRLEVLPDERLPRRGPGRVYYEGPFGDFFLSELTLLADGRPLRFSRAAHSHAKNPAAQAIDGDPSTGWTIDGGQGRAHAAAFQLAAPAPRAGSFRLELLFERYHAAGLGRFRLWSTKDPRPAEAQTPAQEELLAKDGLRAFLLQAPELEKERKEIAELRRQAPAAPTTLVFQERPAANPRATRLHKRGEWLQPAEAVAPGVPAALPATSARDRLGFAKWLVEPAHPLVSRVTVNRQWAAFFGRGIVRSLEDFGTQGDFPSHPELLDWLALEFVRRGWSMKQLHRLIVTSATYRQASRVSPELLRRDPENRLLARGPRFRVDAELVRDSALAAAGLLSPKLGGPSVFPPQPASVTTEGAYGKLEWKASTGEDRHRRGLYTYAKRTAPFAMGVAFDGPSGEQCLARREVSNTPLQALTLLNDAVFVEAAQALGKLAAAEPGTDRDRAAFLFRRCLSRAPAPEEAARLEAFVARQKARFEAKELDPAALGGPGADAARAAWTAAARALLNLDEFVTKE